MKAKLWFNLPLQSTLVQSVPMVPKKLVTKAKLLVQPATPEYTGSISSDTTSANGTQEVGHEGEAVVQPANPEYTGQQRTTVLTVPKKLGHEGEACGSTCSLQSTPAQSVLMVRKKLGHEGEAAGSTR